MDVQVALNVVKQLTAIHERAGLALQAYGAGEDSEELLTTLISAIGGIWIETNDPDLDDGEKMRAFAELMGDVLLDRERNKNIFFGMAITTANPSYYVKPNLKPHQAEGDSRGNGFAGEMGEY